MQEALQSVFGPWVSIAGFAVLILMFAPKVVDWWKRRKQRKLQKDPLLDKIQLEDRILQFKGEAPDLPAHPQFGAAKANLKAKKKYIALWSFVWMLPFLINLVLSLLWTVTQPLFFITFPLFILGVCRIRHIGDYTIFYNTGFVQNSGYHKREIDYNAISKFDKRENPMNGLASSYIFIIEKGSLISFNVNDYYNCSEIVNKVIKGLGQRSVKSAAPLSEEDLAILSESNNKPSKDPSKVAPPNQGVAAPKF